MEFNGSNDQFGKKTRSIESLSILSLFFYFCFVSFFCDCECLAIGGGRRQKGKFLMSKFNVQALPSSSSTERVFSLRREYFKRLLDCREKGALDNKFLLLLRASSRGSSLFAHDSQSCIKKEKVIGIGR